MSQSDKSARRRNIESLRHSWHEKVASDPGLRRNPAAHIMATYIRKRFRADLGYAEFSIGGASKELGLPKTSVIRGRNALIKRGWLRLIERQMDQSKGWAANRYILTGGPLDFDLDSHSRDLSDANDASDTDDTGEPVA